MAMKLYYSPTSPFARKVRIVAAEKGLTSQIELVTTPVSPTDTALPPGLNNPLGKIPAFTTNDGLTLYDSRVICEYLEAIYPDPQLVPKQGNDRWEVLRRQALADGLVDATVLLRYEESLRPQAVRWEEWSQGQLRKVQRSLAQLESEVSAMQSFYLDLIATISALGYLELRFPDFEWRAQAPNLAGLCKEHGQRSSVANSRLIG